MFFLELIEALVEGLGARSGGPGTVSKDEGLATQRLGLSCAFFLALEVSTVLRATLGF